MKTKKKHISAGLFIFLSLAFSFYSFFGKTNFSILETSVLSILKNIAEKNAPKPPDLGIKKITLEKVGNPTKNFNYYKYKASIVLTNHGGNLTNEKVLLRGDKNQKTVLVRNTYKGFSLRSGENYTIRNYDIIFDGEYNGGEIPFEIKLVDKTDHDKGNNRYIVDIFESPVKITDISLDEILEDGTFVLNFNAIPFSFRKHNFEVLANDNLVFDEKDVRYDEIYSWDNIYNYYHAKNSLKTVKSGFISNQTTELESHFIKFSADPFADKNSHCAHIKATNPENNYYAVSNVLCFKPQETLTRAQFAKLFVENVGIKFSDDDHDYFDDVSEDESYYPHVQTLYDLGLLDVMDSSYSPDKIITRGEIIRIALDYFDVDLAIKEGTPHFKDVTEDDLLYPYAETFYASAKENIPLEYLKPDKPATQNYLKHLIDVYSENN